MSRSKRMQLVQRAADDVERRRAERLAATDRRIGECETKLAELEAYQTGYAREFAQRAARGIGGAGLRDYQTFMSRLGEAVRQQAQLLTRVREERERVLLEWQDAVQRAHAIEQVVVRSQAEERRTAERAEQHETDERAQRRAARPGGTW